MIGVTVVIPVRNGASCIRETLESVWAQDCEPMEIIVVDDGSTDGSLELVKEIAGRRPIITIPGESRGAAAALNAGLRAASCPIVCQVDQDVVLEPGWMVALVRRLEKPDVAAAQGMYVNDERAPLLSRVMSRDLEERYAAVPSETDHVCTGNVAYRAVALRQIGYFDETLGYGYDNDVSYRLRSAGYRLMFCPDARSTHRWREGIAGYFRQQYGFGYGRLDVVAKHPRRVRGDRVSPMLMMLHPIVLLIALLSLSSRFVLPGRTVSVQTFAVSLIAALCIERAFVGIRAARRFRDLTPLWFPLVHLVRDVAWVSAIVVWTARRVIGAKAAPAHSMRPRTATADQRNVAGVVRAFRPAVTADLKVCTTTVPSTADLKVRTTTVPLVVIPAFNEALNLQSVVHEIRACHPNIEILVVDDGSTDETEDVVTRLGVRRVRLPQRMGVGGAMRVGLRYAMRQGFNVVVRLDGDGQHRPEDITELLSPVLAGRADVTLGSRQFTEHGRQDRGLAFIKRPLAVCLTVLTRRTVTDPTCGLCAMGGRAVRLLSERHPTGYPEPELRLLLSRTGLVTVEVPVGGRPRLNGKSTLTPVRMIAAAARVALAICVVPFRPVETEPAGD